MLRNREIRFVLLVMCTISLLLLLSAAFFSISSVILVLLTSVLLIGCSLIFTRMRYLEIEKLSSYMRQISSGDYSLDVRDNREGEFSILKNTIYKVTVMLSEQRTLLQKDKTHLTDAISDISHQLKTPLTSMMVMADLLDDTHLPETKRAEFTRNIRIQLERLEWLVTSLLKLSKIDAGTVHFKNDHVIVVKLIQKALQPVLIPIDIKEQTVTITGDDNVAFVGDLNWAAEAVINILKNAVEHTDSGGSIAIAFSENPLYTEIVIRDTGKGIPRDEIPFIFKRFYKGKYAGESSIGIGLSMAHSIITKQNGTIDVQSEIHKGTQFRIRIYKQIV
ncbi:two-component sensor histidine kinase [Paenibacillus pectinilyticus]|uniref:histidine kinase n=1 Tax=Paenibacillus pectinilyticus TaxID=512399 RepID=A0A1C1A4N3_9BACL|nr:HAMP domain-containing sensor histidine kinase [Paenibacillus pectinilyticus]OCT15450.1 two-component sensor histidine kinase [Paenibacillus pectinilyticus]